MKKDIPAIGSVLKEILPKLDQLPSKTILEVNLRDQNTSKLICRSFNRLARFGPRKSPTGASKMLHIVYPRLFVMWDEAIRGGYGCSKGEGDQYVDFLRRMQRLANYAICQIENECGVSRGEVIARLKCDGHTIAKALDEYNYVKFTLNDGSVRQTEYESCSSP